MGFKFNSTCLEMFDVLVLHLRSIGIDVYDKIEFGMFWHL